MASYFAYLGALSVVATVLVIEPDVVARGQHGDAARAVQTYIDGSKYGRYAGRGATFDPLNGVFTTTPLSGTLSTPIGVSDPRIEFSDSIEPTERSFAKISVTRPISDSVNFKFCAPNARARFVTNATTVEMGLRYTKQTTHGAFNSTTEILVDGVTNTTFVAPNNNAHNDPPSVLAKTISFGSAVNRTIELIWPFGDSMEFTYIRTNSGATVSAPTPRPARKICLLGDSITQGFSLGQPSQTWAFKLGALKGRQIVNLGYGGRTAVPSDGSAVAGTGCDAVFYMIGTNDFNGQVAINTFRTNVQGVLQNIRGALPAAKIYTSGPLYLTTSLAIPASSYRTAVSEAVAGIGDANTTYVDGLTLMTNNSNRLSDGTHPNETGSTEIANALSAIIQ